VSVAGSAIRCLCRNWAEEELEQNAFAPALSQADKARHAQDQQAFCVGYALRPPKRQAGVLAQPSRSRHMLRLAGRG